MILVDTSVWVDHLRRGHAGLAALLQEGRVLTHPVVIGELACGRLKARAQVLPWLDALPRATAATDAEARACVELHDLAGSGLGWIDVHLLASALLSGRPLWTQDRRLAAVARRLGVGA